MKVLLVDWLGRGGIAQATAAWERELVRDAHETLVVSRPGRELTVTNGTADPPRGRWRAHLQVVRAASDAIRAHQPDVVIIQNYLVPALEQSVARTARAHGCRVVAVVHNHAPHSVLGGLDAGLRSWLRLADDVVVHSHFVGDRLPGRPRYECLPLPAYFQVLEAEGGTSIVPDEHHAGNDLVAFHFGVLKRRYKNTGVVLELARRGLPGWRFVFAGVGAPDPAPGIVSVNRFVAASDLRSTLEDATVTLLPYRTATQSGAVGLSQALGSIPMATSVGGLPEQIEDRRTGRLIPPDGNVSAWADALVAMRDPIERAGLVAGGRRAATAAHAEFVAGLRILAPVGGHPVA